MAGWTAGRLGACARVARGRETEYPLPRAPSSVRLSASSLSRLPGRERLPRPSLAVSLAPGKVISFAFSLSATALVFLTVFSLSLLLHPSLSLSVFTPARPSTRLLLFLPLESHRTARCSIRLRGGGTSVQLFSLSFSRLLARASFLFVVPAVRIAPCPSPSIRLASVSLPRLLQLQPAPREKPILPRPRRRHTYLCALLPLPSRTRRPLSARFSGILCRFVVENFVPSHDAATRSDQPQDLARSPGSRSWTNFSAPREVFEVRIAARAGEPITGTRVNRRDGRYHTIAFQ